jgi:hypothetical protein
MAFICNSGDGLMTCKDCFSGSDEPNQVACSCLNKAQQYVYTIVDMGASQSL